MCNNTMKSRISLINNRQVYNYAVLRCVIHRAAPAGRPLEIGYTELLLQAVR